MYKGYLNRLVKEMESIEICPDGLPTSYNAIDELPWFDCCLREGLRLHAPPGHIQARVVPTGGAALAGYWLPEDTEVGTPLYSVLLNTDAYDDPFEFKPERWLEGSTTPEKMHKMKLGWMTFGHGARICSGKE